MELADLVRRCLLADLAAAAEQCIAALQAAAVHAADVTSLMTALPPLAFDHDQILACARRRLRETKT